MLIDEDVFYGGIHGVRVPMILVCHFPNLLILCNVMFPFFHKNFLTNSVINCEMTYLC